MRVVNNKISMYRGETPSYIAHIYREDGVPYILTKDGVVYVIEFIIRPNIYSMKDDYIFRRYYKVEHKRFDKKEAEDYSKIDSYWNDDLGGTPDVLYFLKVNNVYEYRYFNGERWVDYLFTLHVPFLHEETKHFEPKRYYYEISILQTLEEPVDTNTPPDVILYKYVILQPTEFNVEGSIGV